MFPWLVGQRVVFSPGIQWQIAVLPPSTIWGPHDARHRCSRDTDVTGTLTRHDGHRSHDARTSQGHWRTSAPLWVVLLWAICAEARGVTGEVYRRWCFWMECTADWIPKGEENLQEKSKTRNTHTLLGTNTSPSHFWRFSFSPGGIC